jgi:hypothetical protein
MIAYTKVEKQLLRVTTGEKSKRKEKEKKAKSGEI